MPIVAISVDDAAASTKLAGELGLGFPLLSDPDLAVAMRYGVAMEGKDIAVPATFVVLPGRRIFWRQIGESLSDRPSSDDLLATVDQAMEASGQRASP